MFSPLEEGVKLAKNFLIFRNGKAEKMREFLETQKAQLVKFEGMQLKEAVSFHWAVSPLYPKHIVHLLRYGLGSQEWSL